MAADQQEIVATLFMPVGRTRDMELVAIHESDWIFHCHMTRHIMNQMGTSSDANAQVREVLSDYMTMGSAGMANLLKIRTDVSDDDLAANRDPGFYYGPKETTALPATPEELARDGIRA